MARPKPWAPPVTTAQRPFRSILFMVRVLYLYLLSFRDAPTELGFTRVRQYHCPSRQQPTWMRRPGIHTPGGGYGFRARSLCSRPGMTSKRPAAVDEMCD